MSQPGQDGQRYHQLGLRDGENSTTLPVTSISGGGRQRHQGIGRSWRLAPGRGLAPWRRWKQSTHHNKAVLLKITNTSGWNRGWHGVVKTAHRKTLEVLHHPKKWCKIAATRCCMATNQGRGHQQNTTKPIGESNQQACASAHTAATTKSRWPGQAAGLQSAP